jgi:hypothetical protein
MDDHDLSAIDQITRGDEHQARRLRATLAVIARRTDDPSLRQLVTDVLQGRQSVRRVFTHPTFWAMADAGLDNLQQGLDQLSEEDRRRLLDGIGHERTPDEELDALREPPPAPPPRRDPSRWG